MKIYMIRHGATKGNREHRYVGVTDESLLPEEKQALAKKNLSPVARVYTSPRKRCLETAAILFPDCPPIIKESLAECDFGEFEYCNYEELNGNPFYQKFIDSMGMSGFPKGEDRLTFQKRVVSGFWKIMGEEKFQNNEDIAFVVHGGTIMAILDFCQRIENCFECRRKECRFCGILRFDTAFLSMDFPCIRVNSNLFYKWQIRNGEGYMAEVVWEKDGFWLKNIKAIS